MKIIITALVFLFASPVFSQTGLDADLKQMMSLFAGEFDNFQQVWKQREDKATEVHEHIHSIFFPAKLPAFGENVFYVKQYMDGNPQKIYRQRMYAFSVDAKEQAIRLDIYSFPVDSLYYDSHLNTSKLAALTPSTMTKTEGCAVYWKREGEAFIGYMKDKACNFVSKRSGKRVFITDSLRLTRDEIWIRDEAYDEDGKYVFGNKAKIHHKLKRCRFFKAWLAVRLNEPTKEGEKEQYVSIRNVVMHDQGQRFQCVGDVDGKPYASKYWAELSQVVYQTGLPVMKFAIYEEGKEKAVAYTWTNPEAKQVGINMRSVQGSATLKDGAIFGLPDKQ